VSDERPIDIWNEMTRGARESGRCMFCDDELFHAPSTRRPVICVADDCRKAYHRMYRHLVRNPRERNEPAEVAGSTKEDRAARRREQYANLSEADLERAREKSRENHRLWYLGLTTEQRARRSANHAARQRAKRDLSRAGAPEAPTPD
jgi:hypothetical protein